MIQVFVLHMIAFVSAFLGLAICVLIVAAMLAWRLWIGWDVPLSKAQKSAMVIALIYCIATMVASQSAPVQSAVGQAVGTQGWIAVFTAAGRLTSDPLYAAADQFPTLTGSGAEDVCVEAVAAETGLINGNGSGGVVIATVPRKAYCSEMPVASNFAGEIYFRGRQSRGRLYTGVQWGTWKSDVKIYGVGQAGSTVNNNVTNVELVACNPLLMDNTYPTNSDGAPCAGYFNSSANMPQATIASITAASGGTSTITLSGALSGTPPSTFAGRFLCPGKEQVSAANGHCYEIKQEPTGGGTIFVVNTTSMVACNATCGGVAYLETALVAFTQGPTNGSTFYHSGMEKWTLSCAYTYACAEFVNGAGEEGTYLTDVQGFNGTVYGFRMFVGNNTSPNAYGGDKGGASHSGPYTRIFHNFQAENCEIHTNGCYGMNAAVSGGAVTLYQAGTQMMAGTAAIMPNTGCSPCTYAVLAYSSSVASSTMSKTFVGLASDGIAMGTNSQSIYNVIGSTMSLKDVQNSGTHAILPELTEGLGYFQVGPANMFIGYHCEYAIICQEIGGMATHNETWIEDGSTQTQGATWTNGDSNNDTTFNFELGSANGSSNVMNFSAANMSTISGTPSTKMLKNNLVSNSDCNVSTENNIWYVFAQTSIGTALALSDCSSAVSSIPTALNVPPGSFSFTAQCTSGVNGTAGTYWIQPFNNGSVTSSVCATLTTSAGNSFEAPFATQAGKCSIYVLGTANATNNVTFTLNNATQSTSATSVVAAGANHHETDAATLAFAKADKFNLTMTVGTSDAFTAPHVMVTCW
jgi:hypothetical protein